jgi:predicted phage tail protein
MAKPRRDHMKAPRRSKAEQSIRAFLLFVAGALALSSATTGPHIQAWYKTMSHRQAQGIGALIVFGLAIVVGGVVLFLASRDSDA